MHILTTTRLAHVRTFGILLVSANIIGAFSVDVRFFIGQNRTATLPRDQPSTCQHSGFRLEKPFHMDLFNLQTIEY